MQLQEIQEIIINIQNDSTMMLIAGVSISILLAIVLVVVVSTMRVISYKNRFKNLLIENQDKDTDIVKLEKELQEYKIKDTENIQALSEFEKTKKSLKESNETYLSLQNRFVKLEQELEETNSKLKSKEEMHDALTQEFQSATERYNEALEENTKYRTTNTRLLLKLEQEMAKALQNKSNK